MPVKVIMPQFGESVIEGTITSWLKSVGEKVDEHEPLVEVNTDKVDTEVTSPAAGILSEILVEEGMTVEAGTILAVIASGETGPDDLEEPVFDTEIKPIERLETAVSPKGPGRNRGLGFISPLVARIAKEHHIDLQDVTGSGVGGRITRDDVLAHINQQKAVDPVAAKDLEEAPDRTPTRLDGDEILPLTPVRRRIAEHMVQSERTSPHVTTVMEANLTKVVKHRTANKPVFQERGVNLTFTAYFCAAAVQALQTFPIVNSSWHDKGILLHRQINLGIAAALQDGGLIVPVIHNADGLSLNGLAQAVNDLSARARSRSLQPREVQNGTFTITNHGVTGSLLATPIINQPQCAILGVGAVQKRPVVLEIDGTDAIAIQHMVYLSLTFDHRILDGAAADSFLANVVSKLEGWEE